MENVSWKSDEVRPSHEESKFKLEGVRADYNGARLEVRIFYTVKDGLHVLWEMGRDNGEAYAKGIVYPFYIEYDDGIVEDGEEKQARLKLAVEQAYKLAKKRVAAVASVWVKGSGVFSLVK